MENIVVLLYKAYLVPPSFDPIFDGENRSALSSSNVRLEFRQ